jgi:hypothetical protein
MKFTKFIIFSLLFSSCAFPRYNHSSVVKQKFDFSKGKWIVNDIQSPEGMNADMKKMLFKILDSDYLMSIDNLRLFYPIPYDVPFKPDSSMLQLIGSVTKCDYLINTKVGIVEDTPEGPYLKNPTGYLKRRSDAAIIIYDLKYGRIIYSDDIRASIILGVDDTNFRYAKSSKSLMYSAFRKVLKSAKKNSN